MAEFEARTIVSADYVVVGDTLARVTLTDTATTVTGGATETKQDTAQTDLDTITGTGGVLIGTDEMDRSATLDVDAKVVSAPVSDLAAVPNATSSLQDAIAWIFMMARNKMTTDSSGSPSEVRVYKDNGSTIAAEADVSDAASVFTRGEFGAED